MATINYAAREISVKIVYYGPGLSGKTTNLQVIHRKVPKESRSDMVSLATETDRTLFFDFLPLDLGKIRGFTTKFQLYTVPGQVYYNATRKLVLRGVDGIVFVADSAADKMDQNLESYRNMEENLTEYGYKRETIPLALQYNKRDLPNALPIAEMDAKLNKDRLQATEAVAFKGKGVFESLKLIGKLVMDELNRKYSRPTGKPPASSATSQATPRPVALTPPKPRPTQTQSSTPVFAPPGPPNQPPSSDPFLSSGPGTESARSLPATHVRAKPQEKPEPPDSFSSPADYNAINLEPMGESSRPSPVSEPKQDRRSQLDLEIERYQSEIGQAREEATPPLLTPVSPYETPGFQAQPSKQQPTMGSDIGSPGVGGQKPPSEPASGIVSQAPAFSQMPPPPAPPTFRQSSPRPQDDSGSSNFQQPQAGMPSHPQVRPLAKERSPGAADNTPNNGPMFFTSVNTDRSHKKARKPVNPKLKQEKGFLGRLFHRDNPPQ